MNINLTRRKNRFWSLKLRMDFKLSLITAQKSNSLLMNNFNSFLRIFDKFWKVTQRKKFWACQLVLQFPLKSLLKIFGKKKKINKMKCCDIIFIMLDPKLLNILPPFTSQNYLKLRRCAVQFLFFIKFQEILLLVAGV